MIDPLFITLWLWIGLHFGDVTSKRYFNNFPCLIIPGENPDMDIPTSVGWWQLPKE